MRFAKFLCLFVILFGLSLAAFGQSSTAGGPPNRVHHHGKKNPHQGSVHHAKPHHPKSTHKKPSH